MLLFWSGGPAVPLIYPVDLARAYIEAACAVPGHGIPDLSESSDADDVALSLGYAFNAVVKASKPTWPISFAFSKPMGLSMSSSSRTATPASQRRSSRRCAERLAALIYLDSGMPRNGQSANDVFPGSDSQYGHDGDAGNAWLIPVPTSERFGIISADDLAWARANLTPQPLRTFEDPVRLRWDPPNVPSAAIICTLDGTADSAAARSFRDLRRSSLMRVMTS